MYLNSVSDLSEVKYYLTSVTCSALWLRAASKGLEQIITLGFLSSNIFSELITSFNIVRICNKSVMLDLIFKLFFFS